MLDLKIMETTQRPPTFLDVSGYSSFRACPARYAFSSILGLSTQITHPAMPYGTTLHKCIHLLYIDKDIKAAKKLFSDEWRKEITENGVEESETHNIAGAYKLIDFFFAQKSKTIPFDLILPPNTGVVATEKYSDTEFSFYLHVGGPLAYAGRIDGVGRHNRSHKLWGMELKTAGKFGMTFVNTWQLNPQIIGYRTAMALLFDEPIQGIFVEAFRTSKNPEHMTIPIMIEDDDLCEEFLSDFNLAADEIMLMWENKQFPRRFTGCQPYSCHGVHGYKCKYANLCHGIGLKNPNVYLDHFEKRFWKPFEFEDKEKEGKNENKCDS